MSAGNPRRVRVAHAIRESLVELIDREVSDPRVKSAGLLSITQVELNKDMSVARVYVSFVGASDANAKRAVAALDGAAGFLRGPMGRHLGMAKVPSLRFVYDQSGEFQARMSEIVRDDQRRADQAAETDVGEDESSDPDEGA